MKYCAAGPFPRFGILEQYLVHSTEYICMRTRVFFLGVNLIFDNREDFSKTHFGGRETEANPGPPHQKPS